MRPARSSNKECRPSRVVEGRAMKTTRNNAAAILVVLFAFSATRTMAADWPCFRGPNHDGISTEPIAWPKAGPRQVWKINVGIGHSQLAVVGDRAYTMGNAD